MGRERGRIADWIFLPKNTRKISLWSCLHDGELISCQSDLLKCFVILEFSVSHLLEDEEKAVTFLLKLGEVESVRAIGHFRWVGEFEEPQNVSPEERQRLIEEYWTKWREESVSWSEFESSLKTDPLKITDASCVTNDTTITLRLGGFLDGEKFDDIYFDVFLRGKTLSAVRSDGKEFSLEQLINLGKEYWNSFGN
jgi:hypothetical protein